MKALPKTSEKKSKEVPQYLHTPPQRDNPIILKPTTNLEGMSAVVRLLDDKVVVTP
ncbi:hypothetical protein ACFL1M_03590 [Patescibacteria group bacterium]